MSSKGSKTKRKGGPLRIPSEEEEPVVFDKKSLLGFLPLINIILGIIFIQLIPNFIIDLLLFIMLMLTFTFFFNMIVVIWQQKQKKAEYTEEPLLIYNSTDVSPLVLYAGQFIYGYFFLSFVYLGYVEAVSLLSIFIWIYFVFSSVFLVLMIWGLIQFIKEAAETKKNLKEKLRKELSKHEKAENYSAQSYYIQLLIKVMETPLIKARFLSKFLTIITILLTIVPFIIPT